MRWYRQALQLYAQAPGGERSERCELLIGLGSAQRQVGDPASRRTLLDAAELAGELGDGDRQCRAVLANTRGFPSHVGVVDGERVLALQAAAQALPVERSTPRASARAAGQRAALQRRSFALPTAGGRGRRDGTRRRRGGLAGTDSFPRDLGDHGARHAGAAPAADRRTVRCSAAPGRPAAERDRGRRTLDGGHRGRGSRADRVGDGGWARSRRMRPRPASAGPGW